MLNAIEPLEDPIRTWTNSFGVILIINSLAGIILLSLLAKSSTDLIISMIVATLRAVFGALLTYLVVRPLFEVAFLRKRVIFLRAFSRDSSPEERDLRIIIRSALGPGFSLSGIRAPRARVYPFARLLGDFAKAFKYIGSEYFELEAPNRNWLARLYATILESHAIILDIRTLTTNVHDEVRLALKMAQIPNRIFLLVDFSKSLEEWKVTIKQVTEDTSIDFDKIEFLYAPENFHVYRNETAQMFREKLRSIPKNRFHPDNESADFVGEKVTEEKRKTRFWEKSSLDVWAFSGALIGIWCFSLQWGWFVSLTYGVAFWLFLAIAGGRLWKSAKKQLALGGSPVPSIASMTQARLTFLIGVFVAGLLTSIIRIMLQLLL